MTQGKLRFIIVLISLALLFLIAFQAFWLKNSYDIYERQLVEDVRRAMNIALESTIEKKYVPITMRIQTSDLARALDQLQEELHDTNSDVQISLDEQSVGDQSSLSASDSVLVRVFSEIRSRENLSEELEEMMNQLETTKQKDNLLEMLKDEEIQKVSQMVLNEFDFSVIEDVLEQELSKVDNIKQYVFGIFEKGNQEFVKISDSEIPNDFLLTDNAISRPIPLMSDELNTRSYVLIIRLLGQNEVLLMQMLPSLLVSFLLIIIIASGYYFTISTILKQKQLSDIKTDFINNMTHKLKTPIANISLSIEALLNFSVLENRKKTEKYLNIAKTENTRLTDMVDHVLKISLYENNTNKSTHEEIDMHQLIEKVISSLIIQIEDKKGNIKTDLKALNNMIVGSYEDLSNVIFNLIDNGIKYSFGRKPNILVSTTNNNGQLNISVKDHGIGISKRYLSKIFDKFFRVPAGNIQNAKGFGLGLSYVRHIVHQHGGSVIVESELGKGSEFIINIPIEENE